MRKLSCSLCALLVVSLLCAAIATASEPREVTFRTFDNVTLSADYHEPKAADPHGAPIAILLHMYRVDRTSYRTLVGPLHEAGFAVLALDLRGHGKSATPELRKRVEARDPKLCEEMHQDLRAAYDWLAQQPGVDRARFALVGASIGCSVALRYAVEDKSVDAIVCLSPGPKYLGLDVTGELPKLRGRKLWFVSPQKERADAESLAKLTEGVEVKVVPGDAHGTDLFGQVNGLEQQIAEYLKRAVGAPSDAIVYGSIRGEVYHLPGAGWIEQIKPTNLRHYSSAHEAEARGLRAAKSRGPQDKPPTKTP